MVFTISSKALIILLCQPLLHAFGHFCSFLRQCTSLAKLIIFCCLTSTLQSGINVVPMLINFGYFSRPYSLIKDPTAIKFWNFFHVLQIFSSLMVFLLHNFAHFVHALRLFKAQCLLFLTNFPGPMLIPCPTFIPDSRVHEGQRRYIKES